MGDRTCGVHRLVADVAAVGGGKVLLVKYQDVSKYDDQTGWFLPDDFLHFDEHPRDGVRRILQEQSGIATEDPELSHIESFVGGGAWHLVFHHKVELGRTPPLRLGENVGDARWFPLKALPPRKDVSQGGWAIDVLQEILGKPTGTRT